MRSGAAVAIAAWLVVAGGIWRAAQAYQPAVAPLPCEEIVSVVEGAAERLACMDDAALARCGAVTPGERLRSCEPLGPVRGPLLALYERPLDVNRASAEDLRVLPKVGEGLASRIIEARSRAPLCGAKDLRRISGVGVKRAAELAPRLSFHHPLCGQASAR